ncbi:MAG: chemotaxis protein CheW [Euryarchaeota archaeon]|nr:chemotaxis protein CheW [Euryarchaeota archaeon]MBU4340855.1 chemotaxis protein CheW [Euryarchaeota archaeon]MBU4453791.1 chemotaxis protein CheW [Euryarchaeota archaeon]MCG2737933.1 chemotaxis protein CheW [Candidatus Methanoperedenaceae archaeon]
MPDEIKTEPEVEEVEHDQYLVFSIESQEYGIQAMRVQEISTVVPATKIPNAPSYVEGIMNLRGKLGSVISFRKKFGFIEKAQDEDTRLIIVEMANFPVGIVVDSVQEVIRIPDEMVQEMPESSRNKVVEEYITGVGMLETKLIILLDVNRMLESGVKETEAIRQAIGDIHNMKNQPPEKKESEVHEEETKMVEKEQIAKEQTARRKGRAKAIKEV